MSGNRPDSPPAPPPEEQPWLKARRLLLSDIYYGPFRNDSTLPPPKELMATYGVCYQTLKKVLDSLDLLGELKRIGRRIMIKRTVARSSTNVIAMLAHPMFCVQARGTSGPHGANILVERNIEFIREMERILNARNLSLSLVPYATRSHQSSIRALQAISDSILGILFWQPATFRLNLRGILQQLSRYDVNIAIYESRTPLHVEQELAPLPNVLTLSLDDGAAGKVVGRFLLAKGHRSVTYFGLNGAWSRDRCQGIRRIYDEIGLPDAVRARQFSAKAPNREAVMNELREDESSVWVGENDDAAITLLEILSENGIDIPRTVSIVGFDDSFVTLRYELTSYNFDIPAYAHRIVQWFLQRSQTVIRPGKGAMDTPIEGYVVDRKTVRAMPV